MTRRLVATLLALLLLGAACSSSDHDEATDVAAPAPAAEAPVEEAGGDESEGGTAGGAADDTEAPSGVGGRAEPVADLPAARTGDRVIKEGTVAIEVETGGFDKAYRDVVEVATRLGGGVVASTSATTASGAASGSVTVRVPVERYEQLLVGVGDLGDVQRRDVTAQDVTAEYVDLESRLRHLQAQERFYLGLLEEADGVSDAIAVQQQLEGIQSQVEQARGRLQVLEDRTAFSTLTVELFEPNAPPGLVAAGSAQPSLAVWFATARDAAVNVVGVMLVVLFFLTPLAIPGAAALLLWRALRRRSAPAVEPTAV